METETKRISTKEIITYLSEKYPECFSLKGPVKPLKVGIFQDLAEALADDEKVSKTRLRQALRHYTSSWRYLKSVKVGTFRVDIDGKDVMEIDQEQADFASKTLKESQEKFGNKKDHSKDGAQTKKGKAAAKPVNKASSDKSTSKTGSDAKFKSVKSVKKTATKKVTEPLKPVESSTIKVGNKVKVQLGNSPMSASITEISGSDISVQLESGMVIKTKIENIYV
ncbi:MAG: RNA chaperone ProQ [Colwellia sp.]